MRPTLVQYSHEGFHFRYGAAQRYSESLDILQSGASVQLKNGQVIFNTVSFWVIQYYLFFDIINTGMEKLQDYCERLRVDTVAE